MNEFLIQRIINQPRDLWAQVGLGLAAAGVAVGACWMLSPILGGGAPFIAFVPAVVVASVFGGVRAGAVCVMACAVAGGILFFGLAPTRTTLQRRVLGELTFVTASSVIVWIVSLARSALLRAVDAQAAERLLAGELQHRVKNTLVIVQALASQTFRHAADPQTLKRDFTDRLMALAEAHNVLGVSGWNDATMQALAERALAAFTSGEPSRITIGGPDLRLPADHAVSLALCLHELATNAMKYGSLSTDTGRVRLSWDVETDGPVQRARLVWEEHGGPPVTPPTRRGFGSELLARSVSTRSRPVVAHDFAPQGVRWSLTYDLDAADLG